MRVTSWTIIRLANVVKELVTYQIQQTENCIPEFHNWEFISSCASFHPNPNSLRPEQVLHAAMMMHMHIPLFSYTCHSFLQPPNITRSHNSTSVSSSSNDFLPSYLVDKCGFFEEKAAEALKLLRLVKSPDQSDSVIAYFISLGFEDSQVRKLVQDNPRLLALGVEKSIAPKILSLNDMGINGPDLVKMIVFNPKILDMNIERGFKPKFELYRRFIRSDKLLMKCFKDGGWMFGYNVERLRENVSFFQKCDLSDLQISLLLSQRPRILALKPESLNKLVSRVESLGIPRGSSKFHWGLYVLSTINECNLLLRVELFNSFGWSEDDFAKAFRKSPGFFSSSLELLEKKMKFLVDEANCHASYIKENPGVLIYSLQNRLVPRFKVLKALKEKGLSGGNHKLGYSFALTDQRFIKRYIDPYEEEIPELNQLFSESS